jgi:hypothetical protein
VINIGTISAGSAGIGVGLETLSGVATFIGGITNSGTITGQTGIRAISVGVFRAGS